MGVLGWFGKIKESFQNKAVDVTHRAVAHQEPHQAVEVDEGALVTAEEEQVNRDKIFARTFWVTGLVVGILALIAWKTFDLLLLIVLAYIFSVGLEGPIRYIEKKTKSRSLALFLVYFLLVVFCLSLLLIIPFIFQQVLEMVQNLVVIVNEASHQISANGFGTFVETTKYIPDWLKEYLQQMGQDKEFANSVGSFLQRFSKTAGGYLSSGLASDSFTWISGVFGSSVSAGRWASLVMVMAVFFSIEYKDTFVFLVGLAPTEYRSTIYRKMLKIYDKMQLWLKGQMFLMLYIFGVTFVGLWVLRLCGFEIPNILVLALIAGVTEFFPYIGPILGSVPAVLVAMIAGGWPAALAVAILFWFIQWSENNVVVPVVMNKVLGVRSMVIFLMMLLAASLFGFVGVVIAVPLAVIVTTFWEKEEEEAASDKL